VGSTVTGQVLVIDNYDSFTFNLVQYLRELGATVSVTRNDALSIDNIRRSSPAAIVMSPGPRTPEDAGICVDLVRELGSSVPMLGVCLGHQAIGDAFGGKVARAPSPVHGKLSTIRHAGASIFRGINAPFQATRYHSLIVERATLPDDLTITAETEDGLIMGLSHRRLPVHGVQFHPESIASEHGHLMLKNFLDIAASWNESTGRRSGSRTVSPTPQSHEMRA